MDKDTSAALRYYRTVRRFCAHAKPWTKGILFVDTTPTDRLDITKIADRIYGSRHEFLTVMAAAGMDQMTQPLEQTTLALPSPGMMLTLKRECGFETDPSMRMPDGEPIWKAY